MLAATSLPANVEAVLRGFVDAAKGTFADRLESVVLFGSAAEGKMRATSDVNIIVLLTDFLPDQVQAFAPSVALARAAVRLEPMFLLSREVEDAAECFAPKFSDIVRRHLVLFGRDPFTDVVVPRFAKITRLRQVLLNLALRLRAAFAEHAGKEDQLATILSNAAGPLRAAAATLIELETGQVFSPKEALRQIVDSAATPEWQRALGIISEVREQKPAGGPPSEALLSTMGIAEHLRRRVEALEDEPV
jgi:predicted nucleotidyltransferase